MEDSDFAPNSPKHMAGISILLKTLLDNLTNQDKYEYFLQTENYIVVEEAFSMLIEVTNIEYEGPLFFDKDQVNAMISYVANIIERLLAKPFDEILVDMQTSFGLEVHNAILILWILKNFVSNIQYEIKGKELIVEVVFILATGMYRKFFEPLTEYLIKDVDNIDKSSTYISESYNYLTMIV